MTVVPENFVPGLEGVVAFTTEIAEPDKDGGALRYRGVDIEDLVGRVSYRPMFVVMACAYVVALGVVLAFCIIPPARLFPRSDIADRCSPASRDGPR